MRRRANAGHASSLPPVAPTNKKTPAAGRAVPSATPAAAAATAATKNMDGRRSCGHHLTLDCWTPDFGLRRRLRFFHQPQAEPCKSRNSCSPGSYLANFTRSQLSRNSPRLSFCSADSKSVSCNSCRNSSVVRSGARKLKPFFEIGPDRVGDQNAERFRLRDERQRLLQFLFRADVRRNGRHDRNLRPPFLPPMPERKTKWPRRPARRASTKAIPSRSEFPPAA